MLTFCVNCDNERISLRWSTLPALRVLSDHSGGFCRFGLTGLADARWPCEIALAWDKAKPPLAVVRLAEIAIDRSADGLKATFSLIEPNSVR